MVLQIDSILLSSPSAKKLATFYKDKVGLEIKSVSEMGERGEEYYDMVVGKGSGFGIIDYYKIKGKAKDPDRIILNFEVEDINKEATRLKRLKVKLHKDIFHIEGYGYVASFVDVDGNFFQLVQVRATPKARKK